MGTHRVGVRQAKAKFSEILRHVARGQEYIVTDHGEPVARITSIEASSLTLPERLQRLVEEGRLHRAVGAKLDWAPVQLEPGLAGRLLEEDRDGRH